MRCGTIGSCQSAATSEIVKRCWSRVHSYKWRYSKCPDLYLLPLINLFAIAQFIVRTAFIRWDLAPRLLTFWPFNSADPLSALTGLEQLNIATKFQDSLSYGRLLFSWRISCLIIVACDFANLTFDMLISKLARHYKTVNNLVVVGLSRSSRLELQ